MQDPFQAKTAFKYGHYYDISKLKAIAPIERLPVSIRIMLESLLRNCDGKRVHKEDVIRLARWNAAKPDLSDIPFIVARVILQDFTGVPLLVDLAAMRDAMVTKLGRDAKQIEPIVPVDLVVDHSVQVDRYGTNDAFQFNLELEFERNRERYEFLKWGQTAFQTFRVVPPGIGIVHQVNLEHIATVVTEQKGVCFFDTLVGTDSHTTMINGLGVLGWGVGGIEAEAAMLGQPVSIQTPEVIGVHLAGALKPTVTATDLTLTITEMLRKEGVVNKFVEFFGEGAASLSVADRATIGNMAPEYGATVGFFPSDEKTIAYLALTGRSKEHITRVEHYLKAQHMFGIPREGEIDYTKTLHLNLASIEPSVAGPKRPQDRLPLTQLKPTFERLLVAPIKAGGYGADVHARARIHPGDSYVLASEESGGATDAPTKGGPRNEEEMVSNRPYTEPAAQQVPQHVGGELRQGSVVIAAITSCTNTSNPHVMVGAALLAKKAVAKGLKVNPLVKTSLAPGSRVVTDYLDKMGLSAPLNALGFQLVAYGCTTCIGNSGPLEAHIEEAIKEHDLVVASVLSGNRNFEARIHGSVKANFLMSPPLVVAFAIAGRINIDMQHEPLGLDKAGKPVYLRDIWPSDGEIDATVQAGLNGSMFVQRYDNIMSDNPIWQEIAVKGSARFQWDPHSTYIRNPPYFDTFTKELPPRPSLQQLKCLALFGDSITTDHISPAGAFKANTPAGMYLKAKGIEEANFNSYGSRRGNHEIMMRGTFANVRIVNHMAGGKEGGFTKLIPDGTILPIYDACQEYGRRGTPLIVFAGADYGMGSSRDWAAKGTALLGVRAVVAQSFERIHRSNLIGMGVLPLRFAPGESWQSHHISGEETFGLEGLDTLTPRQTVTLVSDHGHKIHLTSCIDTPIEVEYYKHGGIMPYVLRIAQKDIDLS
ncbi:MAG: hypothetical protein RL235_22 [Chlamydiota bacterium]|jgi:aconitate hydratase